MKEGLKTYWNVVQCYLNDMVDTIINDQNLKYWKSPCNTDTRIAERAISVINKLVNIWSSLFYYSYQIFRNVCFRKLGIPWFKPVRFTQLESVRIMTFSWRDMPPTPLLGQTESYIMWCCSHFSSPPSLEFLLGSLIMFLCVLATQDH